MKNVHLYVTVAIKEAIKGSFQIRDFVVSFMEDDPPNLDILKEGDDSKTMDKIFVRLPLEEHNFLRERFGGPSGLSRAIVSYYG